MIDEDYVATSRISDSLSNHQYKMNPYTLLKHYDNDMTTHHQNKNPLFPIRSLPVPPMWFQKLGHQKIQIYQEKNDVTDTQICRQVPEKQRVSGPGWNQTPAVVNVPPLILLFPDLTEGEQCDGNCENPRSQ